MQIFIYNTKHIFLGERNMLTEITIVFKSENIKQACWKLLFIASTCTPWDRGISGIWLAKIRDIPRVFHPLVLQRAYLYVNCRESWGDAQ